MPYSFVADRPVTSGSSRGRGSPLECTGEWVRYVTTVIHAVCFQKTLSISESKKKEIPYNEKSKYLLEHIVRPITKARFRENMRIPYSGQMLLPLSSWKMLGRNGVVIKIFQLDNE